MSKILLEALNIKKNYGDDLLFSFDNLRIYQGNKIGIIGMNGSGKSTLLNILAGEDDDFSGNIRRYSGISFIHQLGSDEKSGEQRLLKMFSVPDEIHSGGEEMRLKIANAFSENNPVLFADEPNTNLDYDGISLLTTILKKVETLLLISHDINLLDTLCTHIIEIDSGKLNFFEGNYSEYKIQKDSEYQRSWDEYEKYSAEKAHLNQAISERKQKSKSLNKTPKRMGNSEARLHKRSTTERAAKLSSAAKNMQTRIEKLEVKDKPFESASVKMDFSLISPLENKVVISGENLNFSYKNKEIFNDASFQVINGDKIAIIGNNGTGKTTLLNEIFNKNEAVYAVPKVKIGYFKQNLSLLDEKKTVLENLMSMSVQNENTARTILARLLIRRDEVFKKVSILSGGERVKLSLAMLLCSDANVLFLDEVTNYLDIISMNALVELIIEYRGTVLFVSHDKNFTEKIANKIFIIKDKKIEIFNGGFDEFNEKNHKKMTEI